MTTDAPAPTLDEMETRGQPMRKGLALWMLAAAIVAPASGSGAQPASPVKLLVEHGDYWRSRGDARAALKDFDRAATIAPDDPTLLATAAEVAIEANDYPAAANYRARLARVAPNDARLPALDAAKAPTPEQAAMLDRARSLQRDGKSADAVALYRELFPSAIPPAIAPEFYTALAQTSSENFDAADAALGALAERSPGDNALQFAYARLLVLKEDTRADGLNRLAELSHRPGIDVAARQMWREVLLWQGPSEKARSQLEAYLRENPSDPELEAKRRDFSASLPDDATRAMMRGYYALSAKETAQAEREFSDALRLNPDNADAAFMLGIIRRAQGRENEAQTLIARAISLAPDRRSELVAAAGGSVRGLLTPEGEDRLRVSLLTATGRFDEAEQLLTKLDDGHPTVAHDVQLGTIQLRAGRLDAAEASFSHARGLAPELGDPVLGLARVRAAQRRWDEAAAFYAEAGALYVRARNPAGARRVAAGRVELLQAQASGLGLREAQPLYAAALAADPRNPELRFDYARLLRRAGLDQQAWGVVAEGLDRGADRATLAAAQQFALQGGDREHAAELARRLGTKPR